MTEKTQFSALLAAAAATDAAAANTYGVPGAVLQALSWIESEVELPPEEGPVVCVDKLEDALVDDIRLEEGGG